MTEFNHEQIEAELKKRIQIAAYLCEQKMIIHPGLFEAPIKKEYFTDNTRTKLDWRYGYHAAEVMENFINIFAPKEELINAAKTEEGKMRILDLEKNALKKINATERFLLLYEKAITVRVKNIKEGSAKVGKTSGVALTNLLNGVMTQIRNEDGDYYATMVSDKTEKPIDRARRIYLQTVYALLKENFCRPEKSAPKPAEAQIVASVLNYSAEICYNVHGHYEQRYEIAEQFQKDILSLSTLAETRRVRKIPLWTEEEFMQTQTKSNKEIELQRAIPKKYFDHKKSNNLN